MCYHEPEDFHRLNKGIFIRLFCCWVYQYPGAALWRPHGRGWECGKKQGGCSASTRLIFQKVSPPSWAPTFPSTYQPDQTAPLPHSSATCHWDPLTLPLLCPLPRTLYLHPHPVPSSHPICHLLLGACLGLSRQMWSLPTLSPTEFCLLLLYQFTNFCHKRNSFPDFQGHLGQWPRLIHFGISTVLGPGFCS